MVRINLINPKYLADQHLIAEYAETLMLIAGIKKYQNCEGIPDKYCLGIGHQKFFRNKVRYLQKRHEIIKKEMRGRGFNPKKTISITGIKKELLNDYSPLNEDFKIIKKRIIEKINKKPGWYRYYGKNKQNKFLVNLIKNAD